MGRQYTSRPLRTRLPPLGRGGKGNQSVVDAAEDLNRGLRRVVVTQLVLTLLLAAGFFVFQDRPAGVAGALAACYGGAVTVLISVWLGWRMQRATRSARQMAAAGLGGLYLGNLTRYALAFVLLALGLGVLKLSPIPLVIAFVVTQFGFLSAACRPNYLR